MSLGTVQLSAHVSVLVFQCLTLTSRKRIRNTASNPLKLLQLSMSRAIIILQTAPLAVPWVKWWELGEGGGRLPLPVAWRAIVLFIITDQHYRQSNSAWITHHQRAFCFLWQPSAFKITRDPHAGAGGGTPWLCSIPSSPCQTARSLAVSLTFPSSLTFPICVRFSQLLLFRTAHL